MGEGTCRVEGEEVWVWGLVQSMPRKGSGEIGRVKGLPNYTTTFNISKITTQRGKGSIDFHNDLSVSGVG